MMQTRACLRSGMCCTKAPCPYGTWDAQAGRCSFLEVDERTPEFTTYHCGKHAEIVADPSSVVSPAFGAGCCMPMFNEARDTIRLRKFGAKEQWVAAVGTLPKGELP